MMDGGLDLDESELMHCAEIGMTRFVEKEIGSGDVVGDKRESLDE